MRAPKKLTLNEHEKAAVEEICKRFNVTSMQAIRMGILFLKRVSENEEFMDLAQVLLKNTKQEEKLRRTEELLSLVCMINLKVKAAIEVLIDNDLIGNSDELSELEHLTSLEENK
ncbi:unknown [Amedibacillus dolichus CAG:375]|uniref:Uncharacterized protein n=1 Tax=Amedibacillus dolichus CAG:375 TaxID=1263076 RepID=R7G6J1_9FIRM|nr:hypothetical protein [Amedibacillus dolichus]CDE23044.1 unknown [Amedibacillus dolichus CAG:375]